MFKKYSKGLLVVVAFISNFLFLAKAETIYAATLSSSYAPWSYIDENYEHQGYNIDVLKEIAKRLNFDLVIGEVSQDIFLTGEKTTAYQVYLGLIAPSIKEQLNFFFSKQYVNTPYRFIANKGFYDQYGQEGEKIEDLNGLVEFFQGKTIGVRRESASEALARHYFSNSTITSHFIKDNVFEEFEKGSRAFLLDAAIAEVIVREEAGNYFFFGPEIQHQTIKEVIDESLSFAFPITERRLQILFDQTLDSMKADGTLSALSQKYFGRDFIKRDDS